MLKLLLLLLEKPKRPLFSTGQLDKLADIFVNLGIVLVGSVILPAILPGANKLGPLLMFWGTAGSLFSWAMAFLLMKEVKI